MTKEEKTSYYIHLALESYHSGRFIDVVKCLLALQELHPKTQAVEDALAKVLGKN